MKLNIKSLLTGTTLVVASASNINAVPPKGIKLIDGATITHPVFGEMKVISHDEDIKYYKDYCDNHRSFENDRVHISIDIIESTYKKCTLENDFL